MTTQISKKIEELRSQNFDLGAQISIEADCGYGGKRQQFANADIYYHPVMGGKAHEVHGGIRGIYLSMGGHDKNTQTGQRPFGFPLSDEHNSADSRCRVSKFEWGAIYWVLGGVSCYGKIYEKYEQRGAETGPFGYPVAHPFRISDGDVVFFEHGCMYCGARSSQEVIEMTYDFPLMGCPWMIKPEEIGKEIVISFNFYRALINANIAGHLLAEIFNTRLFLKPTGVRKFVALEFSHELAKSSYVSPDINKFGSTFRLQPGGKLQNKSLYDIVLKLPGNKSYPVAPHSVYISEDWNDFKFIHATDVHISRRVDGFRKYFTDRSMDDAAKNFNNFNDNFREFINYANKLKRKGQLDFIMLTGDLVDYVFEDGGKTYYNNNFVYLKNMICGLTGKPDQVQNNELLVPVFTSLGNHDYRTRPYYPLFRVDIQWPAGNKTMEQYASFNITKDEAKELTEGHLKITGMVSSETAVDMIKPDRKNHNGNLDHYFRDICRTPSYTVNLGMHRLVMIDGKWDDGTIEGTWDAIKYYLGFKGEATENFADGSPDSVGFTGPEFQMLSKALQREEGLVIIGMHAPAVNPKHSEYSYYMREYIRAGNSQPFLNEMRKYLFRRDPRSFITAASGNMHIDFTKPVHTDWSRERSFYFYEGNGGDLLDYAVMRGYREDFLKLCAGVKNSSRPADLILSGHVHKNWECRLFWDETTKEFKISHDFYTENPAVYYHSYDFDTNNETKFSGSPLEIGRIIKKLFKEKLMRIHVEVRDDALIDEKPVKGSSGVWSVKTKPYPMPLNAEPNTERKKWWWSLVKPLLLQTAALGPSEFLRAPEKQPDFRGCRLISVESDTISNIQYMTNEKMKAYLAEGEVFDHVVLTGGGLVVEN